MVRTRNLAHYAELHRTTRYGTSGPRHRPAIQPWFSAVAPRTALDYGAGQSGLVDELTSYRTAVRHRYDPAIPEISSIPLPRYDLILCTDVMEHLDEAEVADVLGHIASLGDKVILGISTRPAKAVLPTGENAHATVRSGRWWLKRVRAVYPAAKIIVVAKDYVMIRTWRLSRLERARHRVVRIIDELALRAQPTVKKAGSLLLVARARAMRVVHSESDQRWQPPSAAETRKALADPSLYLDAIDDPSLRLHRRIWLWHIGGYLGPLAEFSPEELLVASNEARVALAAICAETGRTTRAAGLVDDVPIRVLDAQRYLGLTRCIAPMRPWVQARYAPELAAVARFERWSGTFERLIRENAESLCVVGNSRCEIGRGRGNEIDAHQLVIRFNNYSGDPSFVNDYGAKTDVWVRTPIFASVWRRDFAKFRLVVLRRPIYWRLLNGQDVVLELNRMSIPSEAIPFRLYHDLRQKLGNPPSAGLATVAWVHQILGSLRGVTIVGFSMTDQNKIPKHYYTDENRRVRSPHDWPAERKMLDQLLAS